MIIDRIQKSINEAKQFLIDSIMEIDDNGQSINGFPHYRGKKRITEYGGTSSAISALYKIGTVTNGIHASTQNALKWLWSKQNSDGSWQSSQLYCSEVTAGVLNDLANLKSEIPQNTKELACQYIKSCYEEDGYFKSDPHNIAVPHIFTTYICTNALTLYDCFNDNMKENIKKWIIDSHAIEKSGWGITPQSNEAKISSTIYALKTLLLCNYPKKQLNKEFKKDLLYLKHMIASCGNLYENEEVNIQLGNDEYGVVYKTLKFSHYTATLLGDFFMENEDYQSLLNVIDKILNAQFTGGWGISKDYLSMWATNQSVDLLLRFKESTYPRLNKYKLFFYKIPFFATKIVFSIIIIAIIVFLIFNSKESRDTLIVSLLIAIVPWLFKRYY